MTFKDPRDPRDPWAWRNTWTGEIRNDYSEMWIIITLIILFALIAVGILVPLFVHMYCRSACPCPSFWLYFDRFLQVLHELGQRQKERDPSSFANPAFDPELGHRVKRPAQAPIKTQSLQHPRLNNLRHSVRVTRSNPQNKNVSRSKSCPSRPRVPRIKI